MENSKDIFFDINLINDIIDGLADKKTEGEFFEHIKECSKCRRIYEETLRIRAVMKEDGFIPGTEDLPGEDFAVKTMAKIRAAKRPVIIRFINHPAVKTVSAAVACLLIAVFVFRSDLFGRIEGANEMADDIMVQQDSTAKSADIGFDSTEENGTLDFYAADYDYSDEECEDAVEESVTYSCPTNGAAAGGGSAGTTTTSGFEEKSYDDSEVIEEVAIEEETVEFEIEESVECEAEEEFEEAEPEAEEEIIEIEEEIAYEEALPEPEEEILIEEPTVEEPLPEDEEEIIAEEPTVEEAPEYAAPTTDEGIDEFFSDAANSYMYFDIPDSDTEEAVRQIAASSVVSSKLSSGAYEKIVYIPYSPNEDINWDGINENYPDRFLQADSVISDGYRYNIYECTVAYEDDIVLKLFAGYACEVLPEIVSGDFSNRMTYLVIEQTK